jgi:hypothetical protein
MFVLLFAFVFGGVISVPGGGDYHEYLIGVILVQTLAFGIIGPGTAMATDLGEGSIDRFRSLPMSRPAFLLGHLAAESMASILAIAIMVVSGLIVGWGINTDVPHTVAGFALLGCWRSRCCGSGRCSACGPSPNTTRSAAGRRRCGPSSAIRRRLPPTPAGRSSTRC